MPLRIRVQSLHETCMLLHIWGQRRIKAVTLMAIFNADAKAIRLA